VYKLGKISLVAPKINHVEQDAPFFGFFWAFAATAIEDPHLGKGVFPALGVQAAMVLLGGVDGGFEDYARWEEWQGWSREEGKAVGLVLGRPAFQSSGLPFEG